MAQGSRFPLLTCHFRMLKSKCHLPATSLLLFFINSIIQNHRHHYHANRQAYFYHYRSSDKLAIFVFHSPQPNSGTAANPHHRHQSGAARSDTMAPHAFEIELGKFENAPAKIEHFCKFAQEKWRGTTYSSQCANDILEAYNRLFNEQFEAHTEFVNLLTELRELRDKVKGNEFLIISAAHDVSIEPQEGSGAERRDNEESVQGDSKDPESTVPGGHAPNGSGQDQQRVDVVDTTQKENRQIKDKLNNVVIQVQESAAAEMENLTGTDGVLAASINSQENRQPERGVNEFVHELKEAAAGKHKSLETDGAAVPTSDGAQLIPAVDPIIVNSVQLPNVQSLGFPSTKQLQETNTTQPLPGIKALGFPSSKHFQEWKEANVTSPLPSINKPLDGKKLRDSRKSVVNKRTDNSDFNKPSIGTRPEAGVMPPAKVPKLTKTNPDKTSIKTVRRTGQAAAAVNHANLVRPTMLESSDEAKKLRGQWRTRVDALRDILLSMQPTNDIDNRILLNVITTFFWQKKDLISSHKWKSYPDYTCLRRINRMNYVDPSIESISPDITSTKCMLCQTEGSRCAQVKSTEDGIEFRIEP
ncbi:hypothetical protein BKA64DRAFT_636937 [Cadophora sp. MPI-SDFR-AT-0126]|nr:hypothetical protein BKA64DRAFT_636937 [Leotiomycetes sp. MPI-SDFR-AT-0126]